MTQVLTLPQHLVPAFYGYAPNSMFNLPSTAAVTDLYLKESAEKDFSRKQPCTYTVVFNHDRKILCYQRAKKKGDDRLLGKHSIGVGGHIEKKDFSEADTRSYLGILSSCAEREIQEELGIGVIGRLNRIGWINDNSNEVGQVHLGALFSLVLQDGEALFHSDEIANMEFLHIPELLEKDSFLESWSQILVKSLKDWSRYVFEL